MARYIFRRKLYAVPLVAAAGTALRALGAGAVRGLTSKAGAATVGKEIAQGVAIDKGVKAIGNLLGGSKEEDL